MLGVDGDAISYFICSGGDVKTITVSLDGDHDSPEQVDPECAFFTSQTAAVPNQRINPTRMLIGAKVSQSQFIADLKARQPARLPNAVCASPLGTELSQKPEFYFLRKTKMSKHSIAARLGVAARLAMPVAAPAVFAKTSLTVAVTRDRYRA